MLQNPQLKHLPPNICFSNEPIASDFARCGFALYRGSTAAVQAVAAGLQPIYLQLAGAMTIDPMYEIQEFIHLVTTVSDFGKAIEKASCFSDNRIDASKPPAQTYCESFFGKLTPSVLAAINDSCDNPSLGQ